MVFSPTCVDNPEGPPELPYFSGWAQKMGKLAQNWLASGHKLWCQVANNEHSLMCLKASVHPSFCPSVCPVRPVCPPVSILKPEQPSLPVCVSVADNCRNVVDRLII